MLGSAPDHAAVPRKTAVPREPEPFASTDGAIVGVEVEIDDDWKHLVKERLKAMGQGQDDLAAHIGCSQPNVSQTLGGKRQQRGSTYAHAISLATGVPLPRAAMATLVIGAALKKNPEAFTDIIRGYAKMYGVPLV